MPELVEKFLQLKSSNIKRFTSACSMRPLQDWDKFLSLMWENNCNAVLDLLFLFLEEMYKTAVADDKTSGPVPRRGAWMFICFVCVPVPAWHLLKTITKALHSKALLGGPWQQPHVPDYTNVCQRTPSTCKRLLSKRHWRMHISNQIFIWRR